MSAQGRPVEDFGADWIALPQGGPAEVASDVEAWRVAGGTHISVVSMGLGLDSVEHHIEYLASVAEALGLS